MSKVDESHSSFDVLLADVLAEQDASSEFYLSDAIEKYPEYAEQLESYFGQAAALKKAWLESEDSLALEIPGFRIKRRLGCGGMGVVYLAHQESVNRDVALKVLPPLLVDSDRLERFRNEAQLAARIHEAHILPVYDVIVHKGAPIIVMPYIDGADLGQIIHERREVKAGRLQVDEAHPWAQLDKAEFTDKILKVLDQLVEAVAGIHANKILHRDIKPSNVLVDSRGNAWLSDFGLAKLGEENRMTRKGAIIGTPGFISPEQCVGESNLDERTDIFATGATLYNALTLELPYERGLVGPNHPLPDSPTALNDTISSEMSTVIIKALTPKRAHRYPSGKGLVEDWSRIRQGMPPEAKTAKPVFGLRRYATIAAILFAAVVVGGFMGKMLGTGSPGQPTSSSNPFLPIPFDDGLESVVIATSPSNAIGVMVPIDPRNKSLVADRAIQLTPQNGLLRADGVPAGKYLIVVQAEDGRFHEVYRTVPDSPTVDSAGFRHRSWKLGSDGEIVLPEIEMKMNAAIASDSMSFYDSDPSFMAGYSSGHKYGVSTANGSHARPMEAFYLDTDEVTVAEYVQLAEEHDLPLPRQGLNLEHDEWAVTNVTLDQAMAYAELVGKRLPSEFEYEYAATNGGTSAFPWGDDEELIGPEHFGPSGLAQFDVNQSEIGVRGLYSGVAEWTDSRFAPYPTEAADAVWSAFEVHPELHFTQVTRGGPNWVISGTEPTKGQPGDDPTRRGPLWRIIVSYETAEPGLGFRCALSRTPRFLVRS